MVDFKRLTSKARELVEKRGGTESVKEDAAELKDIAKGPGGLGDKAKAAADAIKEPGTGQAGESAAEPGASGAGESPAGSGAGEAHERPAEPGAGEAQESPAATEASEGERRRAEQQVEGEERGKHAGGG